MQLRTTYKGFTEAVDAYFDHLMPLVVPLQASAAHCPLCPQVGTVCDGSRLEQEQGCLCQLSRSRGLVVHRLWEGGAEAI